MTRIVRMYFALRRKIPSYQPALAWALACVYTNPRSTKR